MYYNDIDEAIEHIIEVGELCGDKNYTPGYSGNISVRFDDVIIITTSGSANGYLDEDDICIMDYEGNLVEGESKPSSEKFLHIGIYNKRPDLNAIIHVHPPFLSSFASAGKDLLEPIMAENVFYFGGIPLAKYALPSSKELVDNTVPFFENYDAVLMANHGFVVASKELDDAYLKLELAESYAQVVLNTQILGGPKILSKEEEQAILNLR